MQHVEDVLWLLVLIGVMINIHEMGHYLAARWFDVKVEAFSFGFGTRLFGFRRGETDFRFSAIPFGGYVKMAGETMGDLRTAEAGAPSQGMEDAADDPRSFIAKPRWQRLIILFAGPFMNVVLAVSIPTVMFMYKYQRPSDADLQANIGHVVPDSPAAKAGIQDGDRIVKLDGKKNPTWDDIIPKEETSAFRPMNMTIDRNGKQFDTTVVPVLSDRTGVGYAGWDDRSEVEIASVKAGFPADRAGLKKGDILVAADGQPIQSRIRFTEITMKSEGKAMVIDYTRNGQKQTTTVYATLDGPPQRYMIGVALQPKWTWITSRLSLPAALRVAVEQSGNDALYMVKVIESMVERRMSAKNLTGPIGLIQVSGDAARAGAAQFFGLMAMISLQLAIFNLLPIPVLDGGSILMLLIEIVMRRDLSMTVKETVFKVGFVCIMMLVAFVIFNDISRMLPAG